MQLADATYMIRAADVVDPEPSRLEELGLLRHPSGFGNACSS
jgi:hypothetical protein